MAADYEIRDAAVSELDFAYNACKVSQRWSKEYRKLSDSAAYSDINPRVNKQINDGAVLVAADGRLLLGCIVFDVVDNTLLVHYVYVKRDFRRQGVARELLLAAVEAARGTDDVIYTTKSQRFAEVAERYGMRYEGEGV